MPIGRTASETLKLAGWKDLPEIPRAAMEKMEAESTTVVRLFTAVSEIYEIFYHEATDRYMLITNGAEFFTTNAEVMLLATANPHRLDTNNAEAKNQTMVYTLGSSGKTVEDWLVWVGAQNNMPQRRPDRGFHYVS